VQSWSAACLPILRIVPVVDILFDLIFGEAVTLLDFAFKLISFAVDCGKVIVGEISWGSHQGMGDVRSPAFVLILKACQFKSLPIRLVEFDKRYNEPPRLVEFGSATVGPAKFPGAKYVFYLVQSESVVPNRL
jgi:hypothetical protein